MISDVLFRYIDIWAKNKEIYSKVGRVVSVNESARSIVFEPIDGAETPDVRLQASLSSNTGFVQIPSIDSFVVVTYLDESRGFVSLCDAVDKILIDTDLVQFNGGTNDGLINIVDIVSKLNNLVSEVNAIKTKFNSHIHVTTATIGATAVIGVLSPTTSQASSASTFNKNDFEDTKITH